MPRFLVWLAAAVAVLVAAGPAYARSSVGGKGFPSLAPMKWAQDSTKIFLTVSLGCKRDVKFKPTRDTFAQLRESSGTLGASPPRGRPRSLLGTIVDPLGLFRDSPL